MRRTTVRSCIFILIAACISVVPSHAQQKRGPSTPEERAKAVTLAHQLEEQPLGPGAADARKFAVVRRGLVAQGLVEGFGVAFRGI